MSAPIVLLIAALVNVATLGPMDWHTPKPIGFDVVTLDASTSHAVCSSGSTFQKFRIESQIFGYGPDRVARLVDECHLTRVVLHAGVTGYDWRALDELWRAGGWGALVNAHDDVDWWLEVGNEPEYTTLDAWSARDALLTTYKMLALGLGSTSAYRDAYPRLHWLASVPVTSTYYAAFMYWQPDNTRGWLAYGSVVDYYDGVGLHVYGHRSVTDTEQWQIYNDAIRRSNVKQCIVTEAGINAREPPAAIDELATFARWTPCLGVAAFALFAAPCDWGGDAASAYHLCDDATFARMRAWNAHVPID